MSSRVVEEEEEEEEEEAAASGAIWTGPISITTDNADVKMRAAASFDDSSLIKWETQKSEFDPQEKFHVECISQIDGCETNIKLRLYIISFLTERTLRGRGLRGAGPQRGGVSGMRSFCSKTDFLKFILIHTNIFVFP